jgi:isopenicillin N synthase-like dioxygenase
MLNRLSGDFGYRPVGIEYSQSPDRPDPIESFTVSSRTKDQILELHSKNARALYQRMLDTIELLEPLAEELTVQLATLLAKSDYHTLLRGAVRDWSSFQLNYSRPANVTSEFIHEAHEDGHLFTIACATAPGLEILRSDGTHYPCTNAEPTLVVMPGEIAWLLSGGQVMPIHHQVRRDPRLAERMALLFFVDIDPRLCVPWVRNQVNAGINIGARVLTNSTRFGVRPFTL